MKSPMRSPAIGAVVASTVLAALALVPAASANRPVRDINPAPEDMVSDQCASPILAHIQGSEIVTVFTDRDQNPVKLIAIFPGNTLTLTNLDTGRSITFLGSTSSF